MTIRTQAALALLLAAGLLSAADKGKPAPVTMKFQVDGLFRKDCIADLRQAMKKIEKVELVSLDYDNAEATFRFVPKEAFPHAGKPEQYVEHFNNILRHASGHTIGVKPPRATPRDRLKWVEIPVAGCHCKACDLGAYWIVTRLPGVEQGQACFQEGRVRALIDPTRISVEKIRAELKRREVDVKPAR